MDWEKAKEIHKKEKAQAKIKLKKKIIEQLKRDRTNMSSFGVGPQLGISILECEVILDLFEEKEKL